MKCNHTKRVYVENIVINWDGDEEDYGGWEDKSTTEDVDTHRYRCTQCGEVMYYSGRARSFYEQGVRHAGINGLE